MTKSKSSMVTRDILYLTIDTFLDVVVKKNSPLGWYLSRMVSDNRYLPGDSNENALCISSTGNVFVTRWVIPLVTIPLLGFVMIFSCRNTLLFIILETVLRHFCQAVGIDYQDTMVNWTPIPEDCMEQLRIYPGLLPIGNRPQTNFYHLHPKPLLKMINCLKMWKEP